MSEPVSTHTIFAQRYQVEREIGRGGMATVYAARDLPHDRLVAVKVLNEDLSQGFAAERFQREIAITAKLSHPNILALHDSGEMNGRVYYVTPFVSGESLRERLARERHLPIRDAVGIARAVAAALEHAHAHGVVHRDVKPENILLADGQPIVADFGIARALASSADDRLTSTGVSLGTPAYMSPEQSAGEPIDARTDIYSLGCVLYEMLAGEPPFTGPTVQTVVAKRLSGPAPDVRLLRDSVGESLAVAIARSLERVPADRIQSATELRGLLDDAAMVSASTSGAAARSRTRAASARSRRLVATTVSLALVLVVALAASIPSVRQRFTAAGKGSAIKTLAVLPLANMSGDMSQDFIADGLTDALINGLSDLGSVNVISRTSVMQYKMMKKPLPAIAHELGADAVLEGSVAHDSNRVRISEKLIRVADQHPLWSHTYERPLGNALALESDIASAVAGEIGVRLTNNPAHAITVKPESQEAYLKGAYFAAQSRFTEAASEFQRAVEIDPSHSAAYAGLARAYYFRAFFGEVAPAEAFSQMKRAAEHALATDPQSAEAHGLLALVDVHYDWDWTAAQREFARALALAPSNAQVHHDYAHFLLAVGRHAESVAETKRARQLDPANPMLTVCTGWHSLFDKGFDQAETFAAQGQMMMPSVWAQIVTGWADLGKGHPDSAVMAMRTAVALSHGLPFAQAALAHALAKDGKTKEAKRLLDSLLRQSLRSYVSAYDIAIVYAGLGKNDDAIAWLRKAVGERSMFVVHMTWDARLDGLRGDPRFVELVRQLGTPGAPAPKTPVA
jgi:serine/threonine-protein kinase